MSNETKQIQEKLADWAKETVGVYNSMARTIGRDYYTQTPLSLVSQSPDMLILGINPGSVGGKVYMTAEELLNGNPCFEGLDKEGVVNAMRDSWDENKKRKGWALWHRLNNMLGNSLNNKNLLQDFNKFVLSNMIFFGTAKEDQIPKIDKEKCAKQTLKLIDDLEPKIVLLLGKQSRDLFNRITNKDKLEVLVPNSIYHCMYGKSHILAIKHTAYYFSNEEMVVVGKTIGFVLDHHEEAINKETICSSYIKDYIIHFEERQKVKQPKRNTKVDCKRIIKLITSSPNFNLAKIENASEDYSLSNNLMIRITKTGDGYLAIRHNNYKVPYPNSRYESTEKYGNILRNKGWNCGEKAWIAKKDIKDFGCTEDEIVYNIVSEINDIVNQLR